MRQNPITCPDSEFQHALIEWTKRFQHLPPIYFLSVCLKVVEKMSCTKKFSFLKLNTGRLLTMNFSLTFFRPLMVSNGQLSNGKISMKIMAWLSKSRTFFQVSVSWLSSDSLKYLQKAQRQAVQKVLPLFSDHLNLAISWPNSFRNGNVMMSFVS